MTDIKGYKLLTAAQADAVNHMKDFEADALEDLKGLTEIEGVNMRWLRIARTHMEQAYMAAVRAITSPETVEF